MMKIAVGNVLVSRETHVVVAVIAETGDAFECRIVRPGVNSTKRQGETIKIRKGNRLAERWYRIQDAITD